jgi:hypothetical protein
MNIIKSICLLTLFGVSLLAAQPIQRNPFTTNHIDSAPADGWFIVWSNGVPVWAIDMGAATNVTGGGGFQYWGTNVLTGGLTNVNGNVNENGFEIGTNGTLGFGNDTVVISAYRAHAGALAFGFVKLNAGTIESSQHGSLTAGSIEGTGSGGTIKSQGHGAISVGFINGVGSIIAASDADFALGEIDPGITNGLIQTAGGGGANARGAIRADNGTIVAQSFGADARGAVIGPGGAGMGATIVANGDGSTAAGRADTGDIEADGNGGEALGHGPLTASGDPSYAYGQKAFATNDFSVVWNMDDVTATGSVTDRTYSVNAPNGTRFTGGLLIHSNNWASIAAIISTMIPGDTLDVSSNGVNLKICMSPSGVLTTNRIAPP